MGRADCRGGGPPGALKPLLVIRHVPWEGPHRILDAFPGVPVQVLDILVDGSPLPDAGELCGAVVMGGPMSANDTGLLPRLGQELDWLSGAIALGLPLLGVCLGSQLLARALGGAVFRAPLKEIGYGVIDVLDGSDALLAELVAPIPVLHWHGEVFTLPAGAQALARSRLTECQAFRHGDHVWGLLFHAESDPALIELWLAEPLMAAEAREALGEHYGERLRADAARLDLTAGARVFAAFAARCSGA